MAEQLPFSCLCKAVVKKKKKKVWRERERTCIQNGEDRIMKIQELVYNRPNLISDKKSAPPPHPPNLCVYSVQCSQKVKLNNANVHSSIIAAHERECYNYVCVQFSVGLCQWIHIILCAYVCSCMCMCSPRVAYLCHCQYVQAVSGGQLCACV